MYLPAAATLRDRRVTSDENPLAVIIVLFVVWAASQFVLDRAVQRCYGEGGYPDVESWVFGTVWKVTCKKPA